MGRVVHFEIAADDPQRAAKFYKDVFDWKIEKAKMPGEEVEYWMVYTGQKSDPGINGGLMRRKGKRGVGGHNAWVCTVDVKDIKAARKKVEAAGGKLTTDVMDIGGVGQFCYCKDTEGNSFSIMQF